MATLDQLDHVSTHRAQFPATLLAQREHLERILVLFTNQSRVGSLMAMLAGAGEALGTKAEITLDQGGFDETTTWTVGAV